MKFRNLAQSLPTKLRNAIYSVLGTLYLVELAVDVVEAGVQQTILEVAAVLGFGLAALNTPRDTEDTR